MRKLTDLDFDALEKLFVNNPNLADLVSEKSQQHMIFCYKEDFLYGLQYSYTWGSCYYGTFHFRGKDIDVADHLEKMIEVFGFFYGDEYKDVKRFIDLVRRYDNVGYNLSWEDDERLSDRIEELKRNVEDILERLLDADYEYAASPEGLATYVCDYPDDFDDLLEDNGKVYKAIA